MLSMNCANGEHTRDLESKLARHPPISSIDEKESSKAAADRESEKMSKLQHCIFTILLLCLLTIGIGAATLNKYSQDAAHRMSAEEVRFQQLLNSVDPSALHDVLHVNMKEKYQQGVFQEVRIAVEAIYQQNAEVAVSLIKLAKRQATGSGNSTVVTTTAVTTTVTSTDSITSTLTSTPSTTPSQSTTSTPSSQQSTSAPGSSTTSTAPSPTTTGPASTSSGTTSASSSSISSSSTSASQTSTSQSSSSSLQDGTETSSSSTRTSIYATTLANGAVSTVTSVTVIFEGQSDQTSGGPASPTKSSGKASLQTGGVGRFEVAMSAVVGGAAMVVMGAL